MYSFRVIFGAIMIVLLFIVGIQDRFIRSLGEENTSLQTQMETLKTESKRQTQRFEIAQRQAEIQMQQVKDETRLIMDKKVPSRCKDAIRWGIHEAHGFT